MAEDARKGRWVPLVYYYLATVVGLTILLIGLISGLHGVATAVFPKISPEARYEAPRMIEGEKGEKTEYSTTAFERARYSGLDRALKGLISAMVGGPVFLWHLRQARRREPEWLGYTSIGDQAPS